MTKATCAVEDCDRAVVGRGWCNVHWKHWRKWGDPEAGSFRETAAGEAAAFFEAMMLVETDECIDWPFSLRSGYGRLGERGKQVHVRACIIEHGPCPPGKREVGHTCGRRVCFNRRHVRWVTKAENEADSVGHGTHTRGSCNGGAKFTDEQVADVRRRLAAGEQGKDIAADLGVTGSTISRINRRQRYR